MRSLHASPRLATGAWTLPAVLLSGGIVLAACGSSTTAGLPAAEDAGGPDGSGASTGGGERDATVPVEDSGIEPGFDFDGSDGNIVLTPDTGCATSTSEAKQAEAALLVVLDKSSSMSQGSKWISAAQAVVQALDEDIFNSMSVGLYAAPSGSVTGPSCIFGFPVSCAVPPFPQVPLAAAGLNKSTAGNGVRRDIYNWLNVNGPDQGLGDASPFYGALQAAIGALQGYTQAEKRILLAVTDGTVSCNELSSPARPGYPDANGCARDWENPSNIVDLVTTAHNDPLKPVETFVVGVPGADSYDATGANFPPYRMRAALSAIAYAGSPTLVPQNCTGTTYTQAAPDPTISCHFDMTQGNFNASNLAAIIGGLRGKVLGCLFDLPQPDGGQLDKSKVNVEITSGGTTKGVLKRSDTNDTCEQDGCWDYDLSNKVKLFGKACADAQASGSVKVQIVVGCTTQVK